MATITFTTVSGANTYTKTYTITAAQTARLLAEYKKIYGQTSDSVDASGHPIYRDRTNAEIINTLYDGLMSSVLKGISRSERESAYLAADATVTEIVPT